jgi:AraC family transcriptional regulator
MFEATMKRSAQHPPCTLSIADETVWRSPIVERLEDKSDSDRIVISRWTRRGEHEVDTGRATHSDAYVIGISLRLSRVDFFHDDMLAFNGQILPGMFQVTCPGDSARAIFYGACDVMHLLVPRSILHSFANEACLAKDPSNLLRGDPGLAHDPCLERLANALLVADGSFLEYGQLYADGISMALLSRLIELRGHPMRRRSSGRHGALPAWRLKRALEYIDAYLATSICLQDIADAAGFTRMHFAAQFRAAMGLRPHEYLLKRRIEHALELLVDRHIPLIDVAQRSGFRSQSHFTTVFARIVGTTPKSWRDQKLLDVR